MLRTLESGPSRRVSQRNREGELHPVQFLSRRLSPAERNYTVTEREFLAIIFAIAKTRTYLIGRPVHVYTDHLALRFLLQPGATVSDNKRVARWTLALAQFEVTIFHRPGSSNANADALSRLPLDEEADHEEAEIEPVHAVFLLHVPPEVFSRVPFVPSFALTRSRSHTHHRGDRAITPSSFPSRDDVVHGPPGAHDSGFSSTQDISASSSHAVVSPDDARPRAMSHSSPSLPVMEPHHFDLPSPIFPLPRGSSFSASPVFQESEELPGDFMFIDGELPTSDVDMHRLLRSDPYHSDYLRHFLIHHVHSPIHQLSKSRQRRVEEIARSYMFSPATKEFHFVPPSRASASLPTWLTVPLLVPLPSQRSELIARAHLLGHFGITATSQRLLRDMRVYWPSLRQDVDEAVRSCATCTLFRPAPIPHHPARAYLVPGLFHRCAMDLMVGLPEVDGYSNILVLTEYLSRYACAYALRTRTAVEVATHLLDYIFTFGAPREILSDQGGEFVNHVVASLCTGLNIFRRTSSPYHPSTNGLVERTNRVLIGALETCCADHATTWPKMLQFVVFSYRTLPLDSLGGYSPFEVMFGRQHNSFVSFADAPPASSSLPLSLLDRATEIRSHVEGLLPKIQARQHASKVQQQAQQDRDNATQLVEAPLVPGQVVFARILTRHSKLQGPRFTGPYKIARVHRGGNYSLRSPTGKLLQRSYPLDHLRVIAPHIADNIWKQLTVDKVPAGELIYVPDRILDHRTHIGGETEYLITWEGFSHDFDSWELQSSILSADLIASYWGMSHSSPQLSPSMLAAQICAQPQPAMTTPAPLFIQLAMPINAPLFTFVSPLASSSSSLLSQAPSAPHDPMHGPFPAHFGSRSMFTSAPVATSYSHLPSPPISLVPLHDSQATRLSVISPPSSILPLHAVVTLQPPPPHPLHPEIYIPDSDPPRQGHFAPRANRRL